MFLSRPEPLPIVLCDQIRLDPDTRRKTLLGVYPHVVADAFPLTLPQAWLYVPFTGAQGMLTLTVRVLAGESVLFEAGGQLTCGDPEAPAAFALRPACWRTNRRTLDPLTTPTAREVSEQR